MKFIMDNKIDKIAIMKKEQVILVCVTVLIFFIHIVHIRDIGIMYVLDDEYGYWGNAAYLSGLDWSHTVSKIPYYSYGYSLLLVPLFWIFENTIQMYKVAIVVNGIIVSASFLLCYNIAKKLTYNTNKFILLGISFFISIYPTYIVYSHIAWGECLLAFVFWLLTWCFIDIDKEENVIKFITIGFFSSYMYIIHQRAIGILIASIAVILVMKILNRIKTKQLVSALLPIIIILVIHFYFKNNIIDKLWLNGPWMSTNNYYGQVSKVSQILSLDGLVSFFKVLFGQIFYLGAASYLIFFWGIYGLFQKSRKMFSAFLTNKSTSISYDDRTFVYLFLSISIIFTLSISAIYFINPVSAYNIVYGRYNEMILGPILLIGLLKIIGKEAHYTRIYFGILISFAIITVITYLIIKHSGLSRFNINTISTIGISSMNGYFGIFLPAFLGIATYMLIWISRKNMNIKTIIASIIVIFSISFTYGESITKSLSSQSQDMMKMLKITDNIVSAKEELPVYFLCVDPDSYEAVSWNGRLLRDRSVADCYQFLLKDIYVKPVDANELKCISGDKYVITTDSMVTSDVLENYNLLCNDEGSLLFKSN